MTGSDKKWFPWLPVILLCLAIFVQSCFPSADPGPDFAFKDKWLHLLAYGVLAFFFSRAWRQTWPDRLSAFHLMMASICFSSLYGLSDEIHQAWVATRHASTMDAVANIIGSMLGAVVFLRLVDRRRKHRLPAAGHPVDRNDSVV